MMFTSCLLEDFLNLLINFKKVLKLQIFNYYMEKEVRKLPILIILLLLTVISLSLIFILKYTKYTECSSDSDCVKVQLSCCPCNSGGEEKCFSKELVQKQKECEKDLFCIALDNCKIEKCVCEKGKCVEKLK